MNYQKTTTEFWLAVILGSTLTLGDAFAQQTSEDFSELSTKVKQMDAASTDLSNYSQIIDTSESAMDRFRLYGEVYRNKKKLLADLSKKLEADRRKELKALNQLNLIENTEIPAINQRLSQIREGSNIIVSPTEYQHTRNYAEQELKLDSQTLDRAKAELKRLEGILGSKIEGSPSRSRTLGHIGSLKKEISRLTINTDAYQRYLKAADPNIPQPSGAVVADPYLIKGYLAEYLEDQGQKMRAQLTNMYTSASAAVATAQNAQFQLKKPSLEILNIRKKQLNLLQSILDHQEQYLPPTLEKVSLYALPSRNLIQQTSWSQTQASATQISHILDLLKTGIEENEALIREYEQETINTEARLRELTQQYQTNLKNYDNLFKVDIGLKIISEAVKTISSAAKGGPTLGEAGLSAILSTTEYMVNRKVGKSKPMFSFPKLPSMIIKSRQRMSGEPLLSEAFKRSEFSRPSAGQTPSIDPKAASASFAKTNLKMARDWTISNLGKEASKKLQSSGIKELGLALETALPTKNWHSKDARVKEALSTAIETHKSYDTKTIKDVVRKWWDGDGRVKNKTQIFGVGLATQYALSKLRTQEFIDAAMVELEWYIVRIRLINVTRQKNEAIVELSRQADSRFLQFLNHIETTQSESRELTSQVLGSLGDEVSGQGMLSLQFSKSVSVSAVQLAGRTLSSASNSASLRSDIAIEDLSLLAQHIRDNGESSLTGPGAILEVMATSNQGTQSLDQTPNRPARLQFDDDGTQLDILEYFPGTDRHHKIYADYKLTPYLQEVVITQDEQEIYRAVWDLNEGQRSLTKVMDKSMALDKPALLTAVFSEAMDRVSYSEGREGEGIWKEMTPDGGWISLINPFAEDTVWKTTLSTSDLRNKYLTWPIIPLRFTAVTESGKGLIDPMTGRESSQATAPGDIDEYHYLRLDEADFSVPTAPRRRFISESVDTSRLTLEKVWEQISIPRVTYPNTIAELSLSYPEGSRLYKGVDLTYPIQRTLHRYYDFPLNSPNYLSYLAYSNERNNHQLTLTLANPYNNPIPVYLRYEIIDWSDLESGYDAPNDRHQAFTLNENALSYAHLESGIDQDLYRIGLLKTGQTIDIELNDVSSRFVNNRVQSLGFRKHRLNTTHGRVFALLMVERVDSKTGKVILLPTARWNIQVPISGPLNRGSASVSIEQGGNYFLQVYTNYNAAYRYAIRFSTN